MELDHTWTLEASHWHTHLRLHKLPNHPALPVACFLGTRSSLRLWTSKPQSRLYHLCHLNIMINASLLLFPYHLLPAATHHNTALHQDPLTTRITQFQQHLCHCPTRYRLHNNAHHHSEHHHPDQSKTYSPAPSKHLPPPKDHQLQTCPLHRSHQTRKRTLCYALSARRCINSDNPRSRRHGLKPFRRCKPSTQQC